MRGLILQLVVTLAGCEPPAPEPHEAMASCMAAITSGCWPMPR